MTLLAWRGLRIALALCLALGIALAALPLLGVLGFESALIGGFLGSLVAGMTTAGLAAFLRAGPVVPPAGAVFARALGIAVLLGALPIGVLSLNALRVPNCNFVAGLAFWAIVALPSLGIAAAWGATLGLMTDRPRRARALFAIVWFGSLGWSIARFWRTPPVQAYDPFFGWFPGPLYDAVVRIDGPLLAYRVGTILEIATLGLVCRAFAVGPGRVGRRWPRSGVGVLALVTLFSRLALFVEAPALHHRTSAFDLAQTLGVRARGPRCTVYADGRLAPRDVARFLEDCEFQLGEAEAFFGARGPRRVVAYLFQSEEQKGRLLGAAETFVAKPWRREVYLQAAGFPHPVLEHELAHVVAGSFARAPFRVAAQMGGLWPVPGLIEGAAVAAGWERDELNPHQWARAMRDAGMRPTPASSMGLSFLASHAPTAYTVAGSFCRFLVERHGRARFREAYRLGSVEAAYGRPLGALVREWNEFLDGVAVSPDEVEVARHRFDRPSVFGQVCAREIARLSREAERAAAAGDTRRAIRALESICRDDPQNPLQEAGLFEMLVRGGRAGRARALGARLTGDRRAGLVVRGQVAERLADLDWLSGRSREAALAYEALAAHAPSDDQRRMRLVKARAAGDSRIGHLLRRFILGEGAAPEPAPLAIETLHEVLAQEPDSPLGRYLLGRQLFNQEDFERAVPEIARAIGIGGMDEPIEAEARRVLAISLYRIGRFDEAREGFERIARDGRRPEGARDEAASWARRCRWAVGVGRGLAARDR